MMLSTFLVTESINRAPKHLQEQYTADAQTILALVTATPKQEQGPKRVAIPSAIYDRVEPLLGAMAFVYTDEPREHFAMFDAVILRGGK